MKQIPTVMGSQEILDKAFRRTQKVIVSDQKGIARARAEASGRLSALSHTVMAVLNRYIKAFPSLDRLHPFERELIDISVGLDQLRHSLGAIDWARKTVEAIHKKEYARLKSATAGGEINAAQKSAYGRISSVMNKVSGELDFLNKARDRLNAMPQIDPERPTVVMAGCPNVGKSKIVRGISSGKPEVATYPFTTKEVSLGHLDIGYERVQVMDTPGLLDREPGQRNRIELQAVAALRYLADALIYVFDPSETCGYPKDAQAKLLARIRESFPDVPVIVVSNKSDLGFGGQGLQISAETGAGLEALVAEIGKALGMLARTRQ